MSQPPYPPQDGEDPAARHPGAQGWGQPADPAGQPAEPAPPTTQFPPGQPDADQQYPPSYAQYPQQYPPPYGQYPHQYGQYPQPYGPQGGHGRPAPTRTSTVAVVLTVVGVLAIAGLGALLFLLVRADDSTPVAGPGTVPQATVPPTDLGSDPALDALARACFDGEMSACDDLYFASEAGSLYELYADTCAGRQPEGTDRYCADAFPE
jgi:hypothetical protein